MVNQVWDPSVEQAIAEVIQRLDQCEVDDAATRMIVQQSQDLIQFLVGNSQAGVLHGEAQLHMRIDLLFEFDAQRHFAGVGGYGYGVLVVGVRFEPRDFDNRGEVDINVPEDFTVRPSIGFSSAIEEKLGYSAVTYTTRKPELKPRKNSNWKKKQ